jgi:hypothetical protein
LGAFLGYSFLVYSFLAAGAEVAAGPDEATLVKPLLIN